MNVCNISLLTHTNTNCYNICTQSTLHLIHTILTSLISPTSLHGEINDETGVINLATITVYTMTFTTVVANLTSTDSAGIWNAVIILFLK